MYEYEAEVIRVVDGDTIDVKVDLGWKITIKDRLRFNRINAWEKTGKEKAKGIPAKEFVESKIPVGSVIKIQTHKEGKYGRYIAEIFYPEFGDIQSKDVPTVEMKWVNLNDELVREGHARYQEY
jgi:micrococcal nuclease